MDPVTKADLETLMTRHDWRQEDLAEAIGASQAAVSTWLSGARNIGPYYGRRIRELLEHDVSLGDNGVAKQAVRVTMWEHCVITKEMFGVSSMGGITTFIGSDGVQPRTFNLEHNDKDPWTSALYQEIERLGSEGWHIATIDPTKDEPEYWFTRPAQ